MLISDTTPEPPLTVLLMLTVPTLMTVEEGGGVFRGLPGPRRASRSCMTCASAALIRCCLSRCASLLVANSFCRCSSCWAFKVALSSVLSVDTLA